MASIFRNPRALLRPSTIIGTAAVAGLGVTLFSRYMMEVAHAQSKEEPKKKVFGGGLANVVLPLESAEQVNHNTKRLRFRLADDQISGLALTSAILTIAWPKGSMFPVPRPYTPISRSDEPGVVEFLVKKYPNGRASGYLHSLAPGDTVRFMATIKGYAWKPNQHPHITLIAGGAGITPAFQLIQGILANPADRTKVRLVFGVNTDEDVLLKDRFDAWAREFPGRFSATYTVSRPVEGSPYRKGYVDRSLLEEVIGEGDGRADTKVFLCGPPAMEEALVGKRGKGGILQELGYTKDKIHKF